MSLMDIIAEVGGDLVEPRTVIEAAVPLELSGEAVRGRICIFSDEDGREWALRPDLTLPVALDEVEARRGGISGRTVRRYRAPVFRSPAQAGEPVEFEQVGFEVFGGPSDAVTDAGIFRHIVASCRHEARIRGHVRVGDLSVFAAFVDAMVLSDETKAALKRAFRQEGGVRAFLKARKGGAATNLVNRFSGMARGEVAAFVDDIFALTGINPVGERTGDEIVDRLYDAAQQNASDAGVPTAVQVILDRVLNVDVPLAQAADELSIIAREAGLEGLDPMLAGLRARHDMMLEQNGDMLDGARFATRFGRRFTYYDGFVFEICSDASGDASARPFAAGGRYDSLLSDLSGGDVNETAIGAIVVPHRLAQAAGGAS